MQWRCEAQPRPVGDGGKHAGVSRASTYALKKGELNL